MRWKKNDLSQTLYRYETNKDICSSPIQGIWKKEQLSGISCWVFNFDDVKFKPVNIQLRSSLPRKNVNQSEILVRDQLNTTSTQCLLGFIYILNSGHEFLKFLTSTNLLSRSNEFVSWLSLTENLHSTTKELRESNTAASCKPIDNIFLLVVKLACIVYIFHWDNQTFKNHPFWISHHLKITYLPRLSFSTWCRSVYSRLSPLLKLSLCKIASDIFAFILWLLWFH